MSKSIFDSFLNYLTGSANAAPAEFGTTGYSTPAPPAWREEIANTPGFNPIGSGGGGVPPDVTGQQSFMKSLLGYEGKNGYVPGWGGMALDAASGIGQAMMSMKQYGLMEDQLKESKRQFDINYGMQKKAFNNQLEDRQRARVAANPGAYESVSDYMKKYGA